MGWPDDGVDGLHRLLLRSPALLYMFLIVLSTVSWVLIVQRIFIPNVLPTLFWVVDLQAERATLNHTALGVSARSGFGTPGASASAYLYL